MKRTDMNLIKRTVFVYLFMTYAVWSSDIQIFTNSNKWQISNYLVGIHFIYSKEPDVVYEDESVAKWAKNAKISTARFPGGTVVRGWDWREPLGQGYRSDPWDPKNTYSQAPESNWMSLDEYLEFAEVSGIAPLLGVNYTSGILYDRESESIERAADMVRYVKSKGFSGAFYYIGNEDMHAAGGLKAAAEAFVDHAKAMKAVDANIKIFWNDNYINPQRLKEYLSIAGEWVDGCEFHGKWPYGGKAKENDEVNYRLKDWQSQNPIRGAKKGVYSERIKILRKVAKETGYKDLLFANNEYGLNNKKKIFIDFNRFTKSLVVIDYLQNLFIGGYDMAAFWGNIGKDSFLMDKNYNYRMNAMSLGFKMLADAQGAIMLDSIIKKQTIRGFSAKKDSKYIIYLLNKSSKSEKITVALEDLLTDKYTVIKSMVLVDGGDHWGKLKSLSNIKLKNNIFDAQLPPLSYTQIIIDMN